MKTKMFLLVSAAMLLVSAAIAGPTHQKLDENLNRIIDLAEKYNKSVYQDLFVEDVSHMAHGKNKCEDALFCKTHDILRQHEHFGKTQEEKELVGNLKIFIDGRIPNCAELLRNVTSTGDKKPIPSLVEHLIKCSKNRNFQGDR